jgi:hypothetical protein
MEKIPRSERSFVGVYLERGLNIAMEKACKGTSMTRSGFVRYCVMKTLQELSLISEQVHKNESIKS